MKRNRAKIHVMNRIMRKIIIDNNNCWVYVGATSKGYGKVTLDRKENGYYKVVRVHRVVYESLSGKIESQLQLDHLCRNRACCNSLHLEPVTCAENIKRGNTGKWQQSAGEA